METKEKKKTSEKLKEAGKKLKKASIAYAKMPLPKSLEWIYGLGFKIAVLLILKSFLAIRYLPLSATGFIVVGSQFLMSIGLIVFGVIMQQKGILDDDNRMVGAVWGYFVVFAMSACVCWLREAFNWEFFVKAASSNWFMDFLNKMVKATGEVILSVFFWDIDLLTVFCCILWVITFAYVETGKGANSNLIQMGSRVVQKVIQGVHAPQLPAGMKRTNALMPPEDIEPEYIESEDGETEDAEEEEEEVAEEA